MTLAANGGALYDVSAEGWLLACEADIRAGKACGIVLTDHSAMAVISAIHSKLSGGEQVAAGMIKAVSGAVGVAIPTGIPSPARMVEFLAAAGAVSAALIAPAMVAAVAHGRGMDIIVGALFPADLAKTGLQILISPASPGAQ